MTLIEKEIGERRRGVGAYQDDFLQRLLREDDKASSSDAAATTLTDAEIKDNILTMIIAGQRRKHTHTCVCLFLYVLITTYIYISTVVSV